MGRVGRAGLKRGGRGHPPKDPTPPRLEPKGVSEMEEEKRRFLQKGGGGSLQDWNGLTQGNLLPDRMMWLDAKDHDDALCCAESVMGYNDGI